jgi:acyl-CoA thioesterase-1
MKFRSLLVLAALASLCGPGTASARESVAPRCAAASPLSALDVPLPRLASRVRQGLPVRIVAFGSSSTQGIGASTPSHSYPSRLQAHLRDAWAVPVHVLNKGVGGETEVEMMRRLERDVLAANPDLVIWQVGSNAVMRDVALADDERLIASGVRRLKEAGIDVVLMDMQYAPAILRHRDWSAMLRYIGEVARAEKVPVFRRFAIMQSWVESGVFDMAGMVSPDDLHMNDASYACLARLLAGSLTAEAARPDTVATRH